MLIIFFGGASLLCLKYRVGKPLAMHSTTGKGSRASTWPGPHYLSGVPGGEDLSQQSYGTVNALLGLQSAAAGVVQAGAGTGNGKGSS